MVNIYKFFLTFLNITIIVLLNTEIPISIAINEVNFLDTEKIVKKNKQVYFLYTDQVINNKSKIYFENDISYIIITIK